MENLNAVNDVQQAVVEPAQSSTDQYGGAETGTPVEGTSPDIANRTQSAAENTGFRKMRLENEGYRKEIEQLRSQMTKFSELEKYKQSSDIYLEKLIENKMQADLCEIQKVNPSVTELESLGGDFLRLVENGVDARLAYTAVCTLNDRALTPTPPETGAVGVTEDGKGAFFSSKELDRLTPKDLENPTIFKKALKSLKRL